MLTQARGVTTRNPQVLIGQNTIAASYVGVLALASPISLAAWRIVYWQGLLYLGLAVLGTTLSHFLFPKDSSITVEHASRVREGQDWDKRILGVFFIVSIVTFAIAGLDSGGFGWSGHVPVWVAVVGAVVMFVGQVLFPWPSGRPPSLKAPCV